MAASEQEIYEGQWWFPKYPDEKLTGQVTFSEQEGYRLSIRGVLREPILEIFQSELTLFGKVRDNQDITAIVASFSRKSIRNLIEIDIVYRLKFVLFGLHFDKLENVRFSSMILKYSNLDNWFSKPRLGAIWGNKNEKKVFNYGKPIYVDIGNEKLKIKNYSLVEYHWDSETRKYKIDNSVFVEISLSKENTLLNYLKQHKLILDFFNFVCGLPITVLTVEGVVKKGGTNFSVGVFFHSPVTKNMNKIPDMVPYGIIYEVLSKSLVKAFKQWFSEKNNIENSYASFFGFMYNPFELLSNELLMLTAAIEDYHKKFLEVSSSKAKIIRDWKDRILDSISSTTMDSKDREILENTIRNKNTLSLANRIMEVYDKFKDIIPRISRNMENNKKFASEVDYYRNRFAHGEVVFHKYDDEHLFWTIERLHFLLKLLFLSHLGFSNMEIIRMLIHQPILPTSLNEDQIAEAFSMMEN